MWTPKRVLLLLGGILSFCAVYGVYARWLGWIDGLPPLPAEILEERARTVDPPNRHILPTVQKIQEAFGPDCVEQQPAIYPTLLGFWNGDSFIVLASGSTPFNTGSKNVVLAPFSLAVFGKPKPAHLLQPGEIQEITTFHADKAILELDRPLTGPGDKPNLVRMELVSEPEQTVPDPRRGMIHIVNNQRSADRNKSLTLRTQGPVFYRDPKAVDPKAAAGPDIWTDAAVEVVDRQNLPRGYGEPAPQTAGSRGADLLAPGVVPAILAGHRAPPHTVSAIGMRVFLDNDPKPATPAPAKKGSAGFSGVRRLELQEKVLINLWVDARQSLVSSPAPPDPNAKPAPATKPADPPAPAAGPLALVEPPQTTAAVVGGLFYAAQNLRQLDRALLQVDTLGRFVYDAEKNVARFDILPEANPELLNDVQVHRVPPKGGTQRLFSQKLEIEFNGAPTGTQPPAPNPARPAVASGPSFKELRAWVETPGRFVSIYSDADRLQAFGRRLTHEQVANRTTLEGTPLTTIRSNEPRTDGQPAGENILTAGTPDRPATLILEPGPGPEKSTTTTVVGPGRIELYDAKSRANTTQTTWRTRFTHAKEVTNPAGGTGRIERDVLTFSDGAMFEDKLSDYWLKGNELKLWLEPGKAAEAVATKPAAGPATGGARPHRLEATRDVSAHAADFDIDQSDHLTMFFEDIPPPPLPKPEEAPTPQPAPMSPPPAAGPAGSAAPPPEAEKPKPKPPMKLRARRIDAWMTRYPVAKPAAKGPPAQPVAKADPKPADKPGEGSMKYELKKALCEGSFAENGADAPLVRQEPAEPAPDKKGVLIFGQTLLVDHTPDGSVMTVTGVDDRRPAQVHREAMSILGPKVVIDQLHNAVEVEGRGTLVMPSSSDMNGTPTKQPTVVVVHWRDAMKFLGATKLAEFFGKVTAKQNEAEITCHTLQVQFDKPVDFSPRRKPAPVDPKTGVKEKDDPKIDRVFCYPAPGDSPDETRGAREVTYTETLRDSTGRPVKFQRLVAQTLEMAARVHTPGSQIPSQQVKADGPGRVRIWELGQKDVAGPAAGAPAPNPPAGSPPKQAETEMKLTVVTFSGRMVADDKGKLYQESTFTDNIEVTHAASDRPEADFDRHNLPAGAVWLKCADTLKVSSHKQQNAPAKLTMDARGNAFIQSEDYQGWGETITSDGPTVTLHGGENALARVYQRFNRTEQIGRKIVYNRTTGNFSIDGSAGGAFQNTPKPQPPARPK